jgi:hypothetical protein
MKQSSELGLKCLELFIFVFFFSSFHTRVREREGNKVEDKWKKFKREENRE